MNQKDLGDLLQDCLLSINMEKKSENKHWNIPQISKNEVPLKKHLLDSHFIHLTSFAFTKWSVTLFRLSHDIICGSEFLLTSFFP